MNTVELLRRVESGRTDTVHAIVSSTQAPEILQAHGMELLNWSSYFGDVTACRLLLAHGLSLTLLGPDLGLNGAAFHGHWQWCEFLLENGAPARYVDPETGETPLHSAVTNEDRDRYDLVVSALLRGGADPNAKTIPGVATGSFMRDCHTRGETPLHRAALFGGPRTIEMLLAKGADRERTDARGETPLAYASWARRPDEVLRLLLYGPHRIHKDHRSMRENLLGKPVGG
jgi:uncharacterized protein